VQQSFKCIYYSRKVLHEAVERWGNLTVGKPRAGDEDRIRHIEAEADQRAAAANAANPEQGGEPQGQD
jgi:hypothetical protein